MLSKFQELSVQFANSRALLLQQEEERKQRRKAQAKPEVEKTKKKHDEEVEHRKLTHRGMSRSFYCGQRSGSVRCGPFSGVNCHVSALTF